MSKTMKVRISFTIEVDPEMWTLNFGIEGAAAIREDARSLAEQAVRDQFDRSGVLPDATEER